VTASPNIDLSGKTALVTGASRGLGRAIALGLQEAGAHVIASARASGDLNTLAKELDSSGETWEVDATSDEFLARIQDLKSLDILVNNVGINRPEPFVEVSDKNLDDMIDINVRSTFRIAREGA